MNRTAMRPAALAALLLAAAGLAGCAGDTAGPDGDRDGLPDEQETRGWDITVVTANGTSSYHVTSDPARLDTSGAGLPDQYKYVFGLDPHKGDTDGDGLSDCQEVRMKSLPNCLDPTQTGSDSGYRTDAAKWDSDGDGLSDGAEVNGDSRGARSDPLALDTDHDGLLDGKESRFGARPDNPDSDGDGCQDGVDALPAVRQRLRPGLQSLSLPAGDVHLYVLLGDALLRAPAQGEWRATGASQSAGPLEPPAAPPGSCSTSPEHPWVAVQLAAERADGSGLDVASLNPDGADRVYWNLANGLFSLAQAGTPAFEGPLIWRGADGEVAFTPAVLKGDNQNP